MRVNADRVREALHVVCASLTAHKRNYSATKGLHEIKQESYVRDRVPTM